MIQVHYDIPRLLDDNGIKYNHSGTNNLKVQCFSGLHEDKRPSLQINVSSGEFHCFVCHIKGNIVSYLLDNKFIQPQEVNNYSKYSNTLKDLKDEEKIKEKLKDHVSRRKPEKVFMEVEELPTKPIESNLYLENRGFNQTDINKWNIRTVHKYGDPYHNWIYIPIYFEHRLRTYFLRSTVNSNKLYGYKKTESGEIRGYPRNDILFGYDNIQNFDEPVYLFEGIFDKIWFERTRRQSLALLGNTITKEQIIKLKQFKTVVLGLDNDTASFHMVSSALPLLTSGVNVEVWAPPSGVKDANDSTIRQLIERIYVQEPIFTFIQRPEYITWALANRIAISYRNKR